MKIKLYKLLEMIDKGEELPKEIIYNRKIYKKAHYFNSYYNEVNEELFEKITENNDTDTIGYIEIEIIENDEDVEDTKIKPLEINENEDDLRIKSESGNWLSINSTDRVLAHKINEIIKYINKEE